MANIAFIQHRLGRTDGVSLEVDKWRIIMEGMGHTVHYIAGNEDVPGGRCIPELYPMHPVTNRILMNATRELKDYPSGKALMREVREHANRIKPQLKAYLEEDEIDLILPNNLVSVGYNLPGMLALNEVLAETKLRAICHNHDFWWEESGEVYPTCPEVIEFYEKFAPPAMDNVGHVVINRLAQKELKERKGLESKVVPNVFDFYQPGWSEDEYNADFRESIGIGKNDIFFLQATRVLDRKGIELAIDVIAELQKPENRRQLESQPLYDGRKFGPEDRLVLVCAGYVESIGLSGSYAENLEKKAKDAGVEIIWCGYHVQHSRHSCKPGPEARCVPDKKIYSLWDSYVSADFVTYPSYWEGWGNQLIEAVFAKLPVVLFEYPVYTSDLKQAGFKVVSLGSKLNERNGHDLVSVPEEAVRKAAEGVIHYLQDAEARKAAVEHNFAAAKERYSYGALEKIIRELMA